MTKEVRYRSRALDLQYLLRDFVVPVPRKIQPALQTTPRIEGPVDAAAPAFAVDDEGRPAVPHPRIVAGQFNHADVRRQARTARLQNCAADTPDADRFGRRRSPWRPQRIPPAPALRRRRQLSDRSGHSIQQPECFSNSAGNAKAVFGRC